MEIWQVVVLVVAVAVAAAIGAAVAYGRGREAGEAESRPRPAEGDHSLFGEDLPVLPTERRFVEVMPYALIVADSAGAVAYASKGADPLNLVRNLFVEEPTRVHAVGVEHPDSQDQVTPTVAVTMAFSSGKTAQFTCSYSSANQDDFLLTGTEGSVSSNAVYVWAPGRT